MFFERRTDTTPFSHRGQAKKKASESCNTCNTCGGVSGELCHAFEAARAWAAEFQTPV